MICLQPLVIYIEKEKSLIRRQKAQMTQRNDSLHLLMIVFYDRLEAKIGKLMLHKESIFLCVQGILNVFHVNILVGQDP